MMVLIPQRQEVSKEHVYVVQLKDPALLPLCCLHSYYGARLKYDFMCETFSLKLIKISKLTTHTTEKN